MASPTTLGRVHHVHRIMTLAEVNANTRAGTIVVAGLSGRRLKVVDYWARALGGNLGGCTALIITDTVPTTIISHTVATLTQNSVVRMGSTGDTCTSAGTILGENAGLRVGCTVADATTATGGIEVFIEYVICTE